MIFERKNLTNDGIVVAERLGKLIITVGRCRENHIVNLKSRPFLKTCNVRLKAMTPSPQRG